MRNSLPASVLLLLLLSSACTRPLAVFHWDARSAAMVKKSRLQKRGWGYPKHKLLSGIICFNKQCINKAEWTNKQKQHRFKGYKNSKPSPTRKNAEQPVIAVKPSTPNQDTVAVLALPINQVHTFERVYFETGKAQLNDESTGELEQLTKLLQQHPMYRLEVSGHTDNSGNESVNQQLSEARAKAVVDYLQAHGIGQERLSFRGYGSTRPVTTNDSESGRNRNRRVEFIIHEGR